MRQGIGIGDLSIASARLGARVRCVLSPDISLWQRNLQDFTVPVPCQEYVVRANVRAFSYTGILLRGITNPSVVVTLASGCQFTGEPFFPYTSFVLIS